MKTLKIMTVVSLVLLTGCTSKSDQLEQLKVDRGIQVAQGLDNPAKSREFVLPISDNKQQYNQYTITSPTTTLSILEGSWVDTQDTHPAKINYEKLPQVDDMLSFVKTGIRSLFDNPNSKINEFESGFEIQTTTQAESGFWFWKSLKDVESMTYVVNIESSANRRSILVSIDMKDYEVIEPELMPSYDVNFREGALPTQTLNDISLELSYLYRQRTRENELLADVTLQLGTNISGNSVLVSQQDITQVWIKVEDVIEDLGFDIEEEDEDLFVYELSYEKPTKTMWQGLLGTELVKLGIDSGKYIVTLVSTTTGVEIAFKDINGRYLSKQQMKQIYDESIKIVSEEEIKL